MRSTSHAPPDKVSPDWWRSGRRFHAYNFFLRKRFGQRVQKISVDAGFTCPNVDGTVATGGCVFCDNRSFSPSRRAPRDAIRSQIDAGIARLSRRYNCRRFLAYFQPGTNTYAGVERLEPLYRTALAHPDIVGLAIGTRPDCVPDETLDLIENLARCAYVVLEYGMQTIHDTSLAWMNRGHDHQATVDAMGRSRGRGFDICAHVMLGLPGETRADMMATADEIARLGFDAVKLHHLYAVRDTPLVDQIERGEVRLLDQSEYVDLVVDFLERIPSHCVIERLFGDAPADYLVGPAWCLNKPEVLAAIEQEFIRRGSRQGCRYRKPRPIR